MSSDSQLGTLKIYLGYASHTGKTWRLLDGARRRKARGEDVVVGWLRPRDAASAASQLESLELVPPRQANGQPEMDVQALLRRSPQVCVIDELAHTNLPGSPHEHRWQDVEALLAAGIDVVTAVNIQHLAEVQPTIARLLGRAVEETIPDELFHRADEIVLVDASAESVLQRPPRPGERVLSERVLLELRNLALLYSAANVEENVRDYRREHRIEEIWETQERVLACVTPFGRGPHLIQRAYQAAMKWKGELWAIHVTPDPSLGGLSPEDAERVQSCLEMARSREARVEIVKNDDPARGILSFAREHEITQIFLGHGAAYPFRGALSRTVAGRILHEATDMDIHVVADAPDAELVTPPERAPGLDILSRLLAGPPPPETRGHQRVYLGYAPGVGKTFRMLQDGLYLRDQGNDVVIGLCAPGQRGDAAEFLNSLERVPPVGSALDQQAILRRRPQICLVDGLAGSSGGGEPPWQQVQALLDEGIHVFGTVDISEVESHTDAVEHITGRRVEQTVPDWVVDQADEVIFVDVSVRALLNRIKRGAVFPGPEIPPALSRLFAEGSLNALRELAMRLTADCVEGELEALERRPGPQSPVGALLVALHQGRTAPQVVRRGRRVADRLDVPIYAVHVAPDEDWTGVARADRAAIEDHLELARTLHLETHVLFGPDVARILVDFAIRHGVTRMFLGRSHKTGWREFFQRSVIERVVRLSPGTDICIVAER